MSTGNVPDQPKARREWSYSRGWRLFSQIILHPGLRALIRFRWSGRENIPRTGGIILAPNHMSYADWPAIALFSDGYARRYPVFMIKSGIFEVKVVGWLLYKFGQLPVYRGRGDAGLVLKQAERALRKGDAVIVYPEGTATRDPDLWPLWPRKTVQMVAGPPVDLSAYAGQRLAASTLQAATADIMADITALLATIRQETPPAVPWDPDVGGRAAELDRTDRGAPAPDPGTPASA
jgi:1-acyl-sn-glycerol-3-phosphate acyltransferase